MLPHGHNAFWWVSKRVFDAAILQRQREGASRKSLDGEQEPCRCSQGK